MLADLQGHVDQSYAGLVLLGLQGLLGLLRRFLQFLFGQRRVGFMRGRLKFTGLGVLPPAAVRFTLPTFSTTPGLPTSTAPMALLPLATMSTAPELIAAPQSWPLPPKLVRRIISLEYVDMGELVPDGWQFQEEEQGKCCQQAKRPRQGPVTDILLWVECFFFHGSYLGDQLPQQNP